MVRITRFLCCCVALGGLEWLSGLTQPLAAQEVYRLTAPELQVASQAERTNQWLRIQDGAGQVTAYDREPRWDSADGAWLGYYSRGARQAIRWPNGGQNRMEIGTADSQGNVRFRASRMQIELVAAKPAFPPNGGAAFPGNSNGFPGNNNGIERILPGQGADDLRDRDQLIAFDQPLALRLVQRQQQAQFLAQRNDGTLAMIANGGNFPMDWMMVPVSPGVIRLQMQQNQVWNALACGTNGHSVYTMPLGNHASQLWRWQHFPGGSGGYLLENVQFPGQVLAFQAGQLMMQPVGFLPSQQWFPQFEPPVPAFAPAFRSVSTQTLPNPELPPAKVEFRNRSPDALMIILADRRPQGMMQTIRIPVGGSFETELDRDAGGTIVENHEIMTPNGEWVQQEQRIPIPPASFYDVSVYQEFLQSIAIDRTGKSPNPIEDVNYQSKSIGRFDIGPGTQVRDGSSIDVYGLAQSARNPGAVRKLDVELRDNKKAATEDPLQSLLREFQTKRVAF